jgi:hypothetical protein
MCYGLSGIKLFVQSNLFVNVRVFNERGINWRIF